jgi:hypothetical protein
VADWAEHHARLQLTFDSLAAHHEREQARYLQEEIEEAKGA